MSFSGLIFNIWVARELNASDDSVELQISPLFPMHTVIQPRLHGNGICVAAVIYVAAFICSQLDASAAFAHAIS